MNRRLWQSNAQQRIIIAAKKKPKANMPIYSIKVKVVDSTEEFESVNVLFLIVKQLTVK